MLKRARAAHDNEDFCALSAGPEANGPWKRVEAADRFVVFRRQVKASSNEKRPNELEVLCAGRLDASLEEVASILRSSSEGEHNASMSALYAKDFIFGSYEREVPCFQNPANSQSETVTQNHEQLSQERDGFTITKRALSPTESTPGRIAGLNARVDQLHGLSASYLVDVLPNPKGLRVVFHAWFDVEESADKRKTSRRRSDETTSSNTSSSDNPRRHSFGYGETTKHKAQLRRLLAMAHGVTKLPELIRRRRFGVQIPAKISSIQAANPPCEYSEVFAGTAQEREKHSGPPRVVEDSDEASTVSVLVDFLSASLLNSRSSSVEHVAVMDVIRILLRQEKSSDDEDAERTYLLDLPGDPNIDVPHSPIPSNEAERIASIKSAGLLELADIFAPETPHTDMKVVAPDVHDLELLCQLAVKTLGCAYAFVTIMCTKHEHIVVGTHPGFVGAAVPRAQTTCQHALMSPYPFMAAHHEADVRFHKHGATSAVPTRFYAGFPLTVEDGEMTVGMLCCIDSKPRAEITRTQYATMKRLASTSSHFLLQKSRQL
ncbi:hypothetical protein PInf_011014 [Phytophthora infestans]|nr:hypothetical protein PInf_011014 [Phytophthora infestans]